MILAFDIGNTNTTLAVIRHGQVAKKFVIASTLPGNKFAQSLDKILSSSQLWQSCHNSKLIICSVVPRLTQIVKVRAAKILKVKPLVVGVDIIVPIKNHYRKPKQVGQDRLVGAYAAKTIYGFPSIVIDLGTAITLDIISKKGEYEGGMIIPGIRLSLESLSQKTALLPLVKAVKGPKELIGKTTDESILSGIFYGYGAMCRGLIEKVEEEMNASPKVIITGGYADLMKKYIGNDVDIVDADLLFKGLTLMSV